MGAVGTRILKTFWHGIAQSWAWDVERVNKTGWTVLASGFAPDAPAARAAAEDWLANESKGDGQLAMFEEARP